MKKTNRSKKQEKNTVPAKNRNGIFIQKKTDKSGRKYYLDKFGKRRKEIEYAAQWSSKGRAKKETFERVLKEIQRNEIDDIKEVRLIVDDFEVLRQARPLRKKEIEIMEGKTSGHQLFFRATDTINDAIKGGATIKILSPTGDKFKTVSDVEAMELAHRFIDSINDAVDDINKATEDEITSPMIQFSFDHDVEKNIFYLDFRNVSGLENFELLKQLMRDNFDV